MPSVINFARETLKNNELIINGINVSNYDFTCNLSMRNQLDLVLNVTIYNLPKAVFLPNVGDNTVVLNIKGITWLNGLLLGFPTFAINHLTREQQVNFQVSQAGAMQTYSLALRAGQTLANIPFFSLQGPALPFKIDHSIKDLTAIQVANTLKDRGEEVYVIGQSLFAGKLMVATSSNPPALPDTSLLGCAVVQRYPDQFGMLSSVDIIPPERIPNCIGKRVNIGGQDYTVDNWQYNFSRTNLGLITLFFRQIEWALNSLQRLN
ncbi:MAG: hypothetical protein FWE37_02675 [Spirochaetaceae bacterium]|nr:hypothetical protein [Spirochaetaceae bacterium]